MYLTFFTTSRSCCNRCHRRTNASLLWCCKCSAILQVFCDVACVEDSRIKLCGRSWSNVSVRCVDCFSGQSRSQSVTEDQLLGPLLENDGVYCFAAQTSSLGFGMVWDRKKTASKDQASRTIVSSLVACDNQIVESLALHAIAKTVWMTGFGCKLLVRRSSVHLSRCISYCCSDVPSLDEDWKKFKNKTAFS